MTQFNTPLFRWAHRELFGDHRSRFYLRTFAQLLALSLQTRPRAVVISGEIVDWSTGQPAAYTDLQIDQLNFSQRVARTDARGYFEFAAPNPRGVYFLFAAPPRYGRLLQTTFGQTVVVYRGGERLRNVVVPAIPATELSGHVYDVHGHPISNCFVAGVTRENVDPGKFVDLDVSGGHAFFYHLPEADDPNQFLEVESAETGNDGSYKFTRLGADRYLVLTRCHEPDGIRESHRFWLQPTVYPQANSIDGAQEIVLRPGEHRSGLDFHLTRKRTYNLDGKIIFSDGSTPKPWPEAIYSQDMQMLRTDRPLTSTWVGNEACDIDANAGTFRCHFLLPGTYTLYFNISGGMGAALHRPSEFAKVTYTVQATENQSLTVQLHNVPDWVDLKSSTGPRGELDLRKACETATDERPAIRVLAWGHGHSKAACYFMTISRQTLLKLPADTYTVNAFEAAFLDREHWYLGNSSKFERLLMQHGVSMQVQAGQTSEPELLIVPTSKLIDIALASLRESR